MSPFDEHADRELVRNAKIDRESFGAIYTRYTKPLYAFFWRRAGKSKAIAEELVQETFLKAFRNLPKFTEASASYFTYLMKIAKNLLVSYYRKPKTLPLDTAEDISIETIPVVERGFDAKNLWKNVKRLNPLAKKVIEMKYQDGMKVKEIAAVTHKSENAVKILLYRSRNLLMKSLTPKKKIKKEKPFLM